MTIDKLPWDELRVGDIFRGGEVAGLTPIGLALRESPDSLGGLLVPLASKWGPGRVFGVERARPCLVCAQGMGVDLPAHPSCLSASDGLLAPLEVAQAFGVELVTGWEPGVRVEWGPWPERFKGKTICVLDFETTGFNPESGARAVELAAVLVSESGIQGKESWLINPGIPIPASSTAIHGIRDKDVKNSPEFAQVMAQFHAFLGDTPAISGHNIIDFDSKFLRAGYLEAGIDKPAVVMVDTLVMARERFPRGRKAGTVKNHKLGTLLEHIQVEHGAAHRALDDTVATAKLLNHLLRLQAEDEVASQRPTG